MVCDGEVRFWSCSNGSCGRGVLELARVLMDECALISIHMVFLSEATGFAVHIACPHASATDLDLHDILV